MPDGFALTINKSKRWYPSVIPAEYVWFIEGWNGFTYKVDSDGGLFATNTLERRRQLAMWQQAINIRAAIEDAIEFHGGLSQWIDYALGVGWLFWKPVSNYEGD